MAVYKQLTISGAVSFENKVLGAKIINITNQSKTHPASNLISPIMSKTYRTTKLFDSSTGYFQIVFDFGTAFLPTILAMINTNITKTTGFGAYLIGSTSADLSTSQVIYDSFPLYETHTRVLRWYLDTPSTGSAAAKRYWGFRMYPTDWGNDFTSDSYFEIGNIWLGTYSELKHGYGSKIDNTDKSKRSTSFGGATYVDAISNGYALSADMPLVTRTTRQNLITNYKNFTIATHSIVDFEPFINDVTSSVGGMNAFYGKLGNSVKSDLQFDGIANMSISFLEVLA